MVDQKVTVQKVIAYINTLHKTLGWIGQTELSERIRTHGIAPPDGYVLVPIEPTAEMMRAAEEAYMPFGDMGMALLCGNLAAAPKQENDGG